jgi:phosphoglycolate phosphatase-like HAD superfamily hydrolase
MAIEAHRPRLILWDIDHTLIDTQGAGGQFARAAFAAITGIKPDHMAIATGKTEPVILAETLRAHGIEPTPGYQRQYAQELPDQYRYNADQLRQQGRALLGAADAIAALDQAPAVVQTVLTGNYRAVATIKLAVFGLDRTLDLDVGAYADDDADRAALVAIAQQRATAKYGGPFSRANTVVIGDTIHDIAAAHNGGATVIAVATGSDTAAELRATGADYVLSDLTDRDELLRALDLTAGAPERSSGSL